MKTCRKTSFAKTIAMLAALLLLAATMPAPAVKIKLNNGTVFNGKLASQNDNYVVMEIGGTNVSIAKKLIAEVEGLLPGVTIAYPGSPVSPSAPEGQVSKPAPSSSTAEQNAATAAPDKASSPNKPIDITLKNGVKFKGNIVSETENLITLQNENGSKVNIYKNIIADIPGRSLASPLPVAEVPKTPSLPVVPPAAVELVVTPQPAPVEPPVDQSKPGARFAAPSGIEPAVKPQEPEPVPLPSDQSKPGARFAAPPGIVQDVASGEKGAGSSIPAPAAAQPIAPLPATPVVVPEKKPVAPATPEPQPVVLATPVQPPPAPPAVAAVKRSDGKHELLLKNGTVFIGTIVSENDRFLSFSTSEGTTINILKRLIRKFDNVPYAVSAAAFSPADTSAQLKKIVLASAVDTITSSRPEEAKSADIKRRMMPVIAIKPGVSMAELIDSLKSTNRVQRAVSARQIGTMGQWASGSISSLFTLLADTAGAQELPPPETDSMATEKLLPPGFEAARALSRIGSQAIDELKRGARSGNPLVRERSVFGCGEAQDAGLLPTLQQALKDDDSRVRAMAAHGLRFREAVPLLLQALGDIDGDVRTFAASTLGDLRNPGAVKPLMSALKDVKSTVRSQAALSLAKAGARESVSSIAALVTDMVPQVREKAAVALGMLKDSAIVAPLLIAIADPNAKVKASAAQALGEFRDPRAIPSLYTALQEKNDTVRSAVETAIKQLTEIPLLIAALDNENKLVRENVAYVLWLMTGTDLGQDKKAWTNWFAEQGKAPVKTAEPEKQEKEKEKKEEKKKKN